jgi:hypothetical protein
MPIEEAIWVESDAQHAFPVETRRVYFGHETCQKRLPSTSQARAFARRCRSNEVKTTLVTPFLNPEGMNQSIPLIEALVDDDRELEVVCNDWGLVHHLATHRLAIPILGRLLTSQLGDPRIMRLLAENPASRPVHHLDGTLCELRRRPATPESTRHLKSCWLDRESVVSFFTDLGVHRAEISNVSQGLILSNYPGWVYSLHVPEVLITVFRNCPDRNEDFSKPAPCVNFRQADLCCTDDRVAWECSGIPLICFRRANALYYNWPELPDQLASLPIDRIVRREEKACGDGNNKATVCGNQEVTPVGFTKAGELS